MIKIKKGLDLPISVTPLPVITDTPTVNSVSLLSNDFIGMKPTMLVKTGDLVKVGTKIFEDKKIQVYFLPLQLVELFHLSTEEIKESFYLLKLISVLMKNILILITRIMSRV